MEGRVTRLEADMKEVKDDVKLILTNHLPHITSDLATLTTTMKIIGGLILTGISALIVLGLTP